MVVCVIYEFSSPIEAQFYLAASEELSLIKDEQASTEAIQVTASNTQSISGPGWQGLLIEKQVNFGGESIPVSTALAVRGSICLELLYSNVKISRSALTRRAAAMLEAVVKLD